MNTKIINEFERLIAYIGEELDNAKAQKNIKKTLFPFTSRAKTPTFFTIFQNSEPVLELRQT
jgi:hypothetical protein